MKRMLFLSKRSTCFYKKKLKKASTLTHYSPKNRIDYRMRDYHIANSDETALSILRNDFKMKSKSDLIKAVIPPDLLFKGESGGVESNMIDVRNEMEVYLSKNQNYKCYIGQGYYPTLIPPIVKRSILENPRWYTAYTPYQAEVAQGRLEALFNYQIMVARLTGMEFANGSLLDEASAAGEGMLMAWRIGKKKKNTFLVDERLYKASIAVIKTYAAELNINIVIKPLNENVLEEYKDDLFGVALQTPDSRGVVRDYSSLIEKLHGYGGVAVVGTDLLACVACKPPGEMGADITYGNGQRFGTPMGYGGPHAAFFAAKRKYIRETPGRLIGLAKDANGKDAFRIALTTREQHIRREKATSNICTSQVLLANINFFYALFHGEEGLRAIAGRINFMAQNFAENLKNFGYTVENTHEDAVRYFDTVVVKFDSPSTCLDVYNRLISKKMNCWRVDEQRLSFAFDETTTKKDVYNLAKAIYGAGSHIAKTNVNIKEISSDCRRGVDNIFKEGDTIGPVRGEHEILRYMTQLENKDVTLANSMIPLGSCTMKLNSAFTMEMIGRKELDVHPFVPSEQAVGYYQLIGQLSKALCDLTKMDSVTYQSNSGATGEYVGLMCIKRYHESKGESHRDVVLIPMSAHGTNPASAAKAGLKITNVKVLEDGYMDLEDLKLKIEKNQGNILGMMITYPSTHGVFEENTLEGVDLVREAGGLIYIDGANMNAQMNYSAPGIVGDVCHLNLHKTFSIPHGGGGPGVGPVCVKHFLEEFLPEHSYYTYSAFKKSDALSVRGPQIGAAPFGSSSILSITYMYIRSCGKDVLKECSFHAILNANYLRLKLQDHYPVLYTNKRGFTAHEFILDIRPIKKATGITEEDIAKRLMDFGFHAPTQSFPVAGTLMIEPTESESKQELDLFIDAMLQIRKEIAKVESGEFDALDNPLKQAPHTLEVLLVDDWKRGYSREEAAYPAEFIRKRGKIWPAVGRIDGISGDRNLRLDFNEE